MSNTDQDIRDQDIRERNLDRVIALAANGRVDPSKIVYFAEKFDQYITQE